MSRKDIKLSQQLESRKTWKDALVDAVAATFLVKTLDINPCGLNSYELLVTQRLKGAEKYQYQGHHGGFIKTTDRDIYGAAAREVLEETGYALNPDSDLVYLGSSGPCLYRSQLSINNEKIVLHISNIEAEPNTAFVLPLFIADVTGKEPRNETDGEVGKGVFMTPDKIIKEFCCKENNGEYSRYNYFQFLVPVLLFMAKKWRCGQRIPALPGEYRFCLY
jgi:8-oxo-dGTP pyrophosphatase MutT (NUDIX family)